MNQKIHLSAFHRMLLKALTFGSLSLTLALAQAPKPTPGPPLLDPLRFSDGRPVSSAAQWPARRAELVRLFEHEEFGRTPQAAQSSKLRSRVDSVSDHALDGLAVRKLVTILFPAPTPQIAQVFPLVAREMHLVVYTPAAAKGRPVPLVLGPDFIGPWGIANDPGVPLGQTWTPHQGNPVLASDVHTAAEPERGKSAERWQVKKLLDYGYGVASFYYGDLEPDSNAGWAFGVRPLFFKPGQTAPAEGDWGALAVWAWGLSRAMDVLSTDPDVDPRHVAVFGHSRLGKAADWASATDIRFWMLLSNEAGKGGDSLIRRGQGEPNSNLWKLFPYWFTPEFKTWVGREAETPFDGNLLLSLTAPRPAYVGAAAGDLWSDPEGEFLSVNDASRVYQLLGKKGIGISAQPPVDTAVMHDIGYHVRSGKHNVTAFDWDAYLSFMDLHRHDQP